jgi:hypothetical protein
MAVIDCRKHEPPAINQDASLLSLRMFVMARGLEVPVGGGFLPFYNKYIANVLSHDRVIFLYSAVTVYPLSYSSFWNGYIFYE